MEESLQNKLRGCVSFEGVCEESGVESNKFTDSKTKTKNIGIVSSLRKKHPTK